MAKMLLSISDLNMVLLQNSLTVTGFFNVHTASIIFRSIISSFCYYSLALSYFLHLACYYSSFSFRTLTLVWVYMCMVVL